MALDDTSTPAMSRLTAPSARRQQRQGSFADALAGAAGAAAQGAQSVSPEAQSAVNDPFYNLYVHDTQQQGGTPLDRPTYDQQHATFDMLWGTYGPDQFNPAPFIAAHQLAGSQYGWDQQYAQGMAGLNQQSLGLQLAGNQASQQQNAAELGILNQLQGLAGQEYQNILAGFGIDRTEAAQRHARDTRLRGYEADAAGHHLFPGYRQDLADIDAARDNTTGRIGLGEKGAGINHQQTLLGLDRQKLANKTNAEKLSIAAQQLGIDQQQLQLGLQNTLNQLGFDYASTMNGLLSQLDSAVDAHAAEALAMLQQLVGLTGQITSSGIPVPVVGG